MHQLRVLRCDVCQVPFLFESSLEDHKNREHAPRKENNSAFVEKVMDNRSDVKKAKEKKLRTKKKQRST